MVDMNASGVTVRTVLGLGPTTVLVVVVPVPYVLSYTTLKLDARITLAI